MLFWAAYVVGAEVFLRMAKMFFLGYEFGKYAVILFMVLGIFYQGFSKRAFPYWIFLLFLIPGIVWGILNLSFEADIRKAILFNILGPVSLGISAVYCADKEFLLSDIDKLTRIMLYPLMGILVYILLYTPDLREAITGTDSNSATSGGFGPNQVSTVLGLGMFLIFVRLLFFSKGTLITMVNLGLLALFSFRCLITFSRGGMITGVLMIVFLLLATYPYVSIQAKMKLNFGMVVLVVFGVSVFAYSISQTNGLIMNRYQNKNALGQEKASQFSGREKIAEMEMNYFMEHPITGIGVGKNKENRKEETGESGASHSEVTRMLSEHGTLGIINLLILLIIPLVFYVNNKQHIFLLSFFVFWLFTINHAAMRIAAPGFIYALTLLKLKIVEKPALHRE
ncbi:MAG: O-antigen ligase family protein [Bacteroidota bacterium]